MIFSIKLIHNFVSQPRFSRLKKKKKIERTSCSREPNKNGLKSLILITSKNFLLSIFPYERWKILQKIWPLKKKKKSLQPSSGKFSPLAFNCFARSPKRYSRDIFCDAAIRLEGLLCTVTRDAAVSGGTSWRAVSSYIFIKISPSNSAPENVRRSSSFLLDFYPPGFSARHTVRLTGHVCVRRVPTVHWTNSRYSA